MGTLLVGIAAGMVLAAVFLVALVPLTESGSISRSSVWTAIGACVAAAVLVAMTFKPRNG
jgi:hypothetical protein